MRLPPRARASPLMKETSMPMYLHQWRYKPDMIKPMLTEKTEREHEVRAATEAFGGRLHQFFLCMGDYDGVSIAEYPDDEIALASLMAQYTLGRVVAIKSTPLITPAGVRNAKKLACEVLGIRAED
jgi:uncharacterized protein with GYD domain